MKKVFLEPQMQKIELNLKENIATSSPPPQISMGYYFTTTLWSCTIVSTGKYLMTDGVTEAEAAVCAVSPVIRSMLKFYPREEVVPYFRM